jgi:hypothetical protein
MPAMRMPSIPIRGEAHFRGNVAGNISHTALMARGVRIFRFHHQGDGLNGSAQGLPQLIHTVFPAGDIAGKALESDRLAFMVFFQGD